MTKRKTKPGRGRTKLKGLKVLLGISGGIAAYKAVDLASKLTAGGASVKTLMTENACELVGPKSFEAVTGNPVFIDLWSEAEQCETHLPNRQVGHISLADWADVVVVAPATANIIAKIANGICDDLISTVLCACWRKKIIVAPAMNNMMWENPAVQQNVKTLKDMDCKLVGPAEGRLACGTEAIGRMAEPADIIEYVQEIIHP